MQRAITDDRRQKIRHIVANAYIAVVIALGCASFAAGLSRWHVDDPLKLGAYLALALAGSGMKIVLPGVDGTMSVNFFFVLVSMLELGTPETLIIGCLSVFIQYFWRARNSAKLIQLAFNLSAVAFAIFAASRVYESAWLKGMGLQFPLLLAMAACTYFLMNTFPVAMIISLTGKHRFMEIWCSSYAWTFPYYVSGAALATGLHAITLRFGWQLSFLALPVIFLVYRTYRVYLNQIEGERKRLEAERSNAEEQKRHAENVATLHLRTIESLALAIEAKDQTTHDHLQRVQIYAVEIGKELGLPENELDALRAASVLHDIGKLAVPEYIISKPGKLTPEEFEKMKIHPVVGAEILECVQFPYPVVPIVRCHHEKWDGTGYPAGLQGDEIPIGARIISAVDCLDALASDRHYRRALPLQQAMAIVREESGKSFDPAIVALLESRYVELERQAREASHDGLKLSTDVKIVRGDAPAAGFESSAQTSTLSSEDTSTANTALCQRDPVSAIVTARTEIQCLLDMAQSPGGMLSLDETLSLVANRIKPMVPFHALAFYAVRQDRLYPECVVGKEQELFSALEIPVGEGLSGWVAKNNRCIVNGNPSVEFGYLNDRKKFTRLRSALSVPLEAENGIAAVVTLYRADKDAFTQDHLRILTGVSSTLSVFLTPQVEYRSGNTGTDVDPLTGLPAMRSLFQHLECEIRRCALNGRKLSLLVCDLHSVHQIRDEWGNSQAERLLKSFAAKVNHCRAEDFLARIGWSKFALVLLDINEDDHSAVFNWFQALAEEVSVRIVPGADPDVSFASARLGVDGTEPEQLISVADQRLNIQIRRPRPERKQPQAATLIPFETAVQHARRA